MKKFTYVITDPDGLHARPATMLVKKAAGFKSNIQIQHGEKTGNAKGVLGVMGLGVKQGAEITITIDGADEDTAMTELESFFKENL